MGEPGSSWGGLESQEARSSAVILQQCGVPGGVRAKE